MADCRDPKESEEFWECPLCTFHNSGQLQAGKICESCAAWECKSCDFTNRPGVQCKQCKKFKTEKLVRFLLIGDTRSTRTAVADVILGRDQSKPSVVSTLDKRHIKDRDIAVINTPDFSSPGMSERQMSKEFWKFIYMLSPVLHAFILVKEGNSFTTQDKESFEWYKSIFGEELVKHMVVVSYGCDGHSPSDDEDETDDIKSAPRINLNNSKSKKEKDEDVLELLQRVDDIIYRYSHFQNPLYEQKVLINEKTTERAAIEKELAIARRSRRDNTSDLESNKGLVTKRTDDELEKRIRVLEDQLRRYECQGSHTNSSENQNGDWSQWVPVVQKVGEHLIKFTIDYALKRFLR